MGSYLNPGNFSFRGSLRSKIYVDKSELIAKTNEVLYTEQKYICVSRPRRFGKSMAANMLAAYYDRSENTEELFQNLSISKDRSYKENLNQYDVIKINMQEFLSMSETVEEMLQMLKDYLVSDFKEAFREIQFRDEKNLIQVMKDVFSYTRCPFVILIDEWDCLFREYKQNKEAQKKYLDFLRAWLKDKDYVALAYMTGILPIKKYGTQSALTDFYEYTMLEPGPLAEFVGFTEQEVKDLCKEQQIDFEQAKKWYDGYCFGQTGHIYNPNSVMKAIFNKRFSNYWTQTETYESLRVYIDLNFDGLKDMIVDLIGEKHCRIDTGSFQNDMTSLKNKDDVLTLLVHLGYLAYDIDQKEVYIPNEEIRQEFIRAIKNGKRQELVKAIERSDQLLDATLRMDEETVAEIIQEVHLSNTTPQFYNNEQALRSVVIMAYLSSIDHYMKFEELASRRGYCDILFVPTKDSKKPALLIELKWDKKAKKAIEQIDEKQYVKGLEKFEYHGDVLLVGISYQIKNEKHDCKIKKIVV